MATQQYGKAAGKYRQNHGSPPLDRMSRPICGVQIEMKIKQKKGQAEWLMPVILHFGRPRWVDHEVRRSRPSWATW